MTDAWSNVTRTAVGVAVIAITVSTVAALAGLAAWAAAVFDVSPFLVVAVAVFCLALLFAAWVIGLIVEDGLAVTLM